jgi:hypothetical protein
MRNITTIQEDDRNNPGWVFAYDSNFRHWNGRNATYRYSSNEMKDKYDKAFKAGIEIWGTHINMNERARSSNIITEGPIFRRETVAQAEITRATNPNNQHFQKWTIRINTIHIDTLFTARTEDEQAKIMAHEIGHTYGLGDLYEDKHSDKLMYGYTEGSMNISASDRLGMEVLTGVHRRHLRGDDRREVAIHLNNRQHNQLCACGLLVPVRHNYRNATFSRMPQSESNADKRHYQFCGDCGGGRREQRHSFERWETRVGSNGVHREVRTCRHCNYLDSRERHCRFRNGVCACGATQS